MSLTPNMRVTFILLPSWSITTAVAAPRNGFRSLMASPFFPTKTPCEDANRLPSARKVVRVKTLLVTLLTAADCAHVTVVAVKRITSNRYLILFISVFRFNNYCCNSALALSMAAAVMSAPLSICAISCSLSSLLSITMVVVVPKMLSSFRTL